MRRSAGLQIIVPRQRQQRHSDAHQPDNQEAVLHLFALFRFGGLVVKERRVILGLAQEGEQHRQALERIREHIKEACRRNRHQCADAAEEDAADEECVAENAAVGIQFQCGAESAVERDADAQGKG